MSQTEGVYEEDAQEAPFYFFSGPTILYYICVTIVFMFFLNISRFSILFNILTLAAILIQVILPIFIGGIFISKGEKASAFVSFIIAALVALPIGFALLPADEITKVILSPLISGSSLIFFLIYFSIGKKKSNIFIKIINFLLFILVLLIIFNPVLNSFLVVSQSSSAGEIEYIDSMGTTYTSRVNYGGMIVSEYIIENPLPISLYYKVDKESYELIYDNYTAQEEVGCYSIENSKMQMKSYGDTVMKICLAFSANTDPQLMRSRYGGDFPGDLMRVAPFSKTYLKLGDFTSTIDNLDRLESIRTSSGEEIINKMSHESFKRANGLYPPNYFNKSVENKDQAAEAKKLSMR